MCSTTVHRLQHVRKKVLHVGQRQVINPHFDLVNPYHADFEVGPACIKTKTKTTNGTRRAPKHRVPTPLLF